MMKAFIVDRYGSTDGLRAGDMPDPQLREDDVLVQIHAAGVNPLDSGIRDGVFKRILPYRLPLILGNDVAGVVVRVGARVRKFKPGDEVYARPDKDRIGAFAEFIAIHEDDLSAKPKHLTMTEAASVPRVGLTAWQALIEFAGLKKGQKVFIHAGSGGVGTFAIQLARHLGATVATTTSAANIDLVTSLGADVVIDYRKDDFETVLHDYDVVLNSLDDADEIPASAETGRKAHLDLRPTGPRLREGDRKAMDPAAGDAHPESSGQKSRQASRNQLFVPLHAGEQSPAPRDHVAHRLRDHPAGHGRVFPFESTNEAMAYVEKGRTKGKVVIKVK